MEEVAEAAREDMAVVGGRAHKESVVD